MSWEVQAFHGRFPPILIWRSRHGGGTWGNPCSPYGSRVFAHLSTNWRALDVFVQKLEEKKWIGSISPKILRTPPYGPFHGPILLPADRHTHENISPKTITSHASIKPCICNAKLSAFCTSVKARLSKLLNSLYHQYHSSLPTFHLSYPLKL